MLPYTVATTPANEVLGDAAGNASWWANWRLGFTNSNAHAGVADLNGQNHDQTVLLNYSAAAYGLIHGIPKIDGFRSVKKS